MNPLKDIDWNEVWKSQIMANKRSSPGRDCASIWESRESALRFWNMCREERSRIDKTVWETQVTEKSRVLDIGAGPGTLAIPFSERASEVTAVEPADGMCSVMREKMAEFGRNNITIVQKRWEEVDVNRDLKPPYDIVIASFSLGMLDIRAAIEKMIQAASRFIYLYHFAGETSWDRQWQMLWPKLHGQDYQPGPKCDVLYNVLYQMGIYPHVMPFRLEHNQKFQTLDEAVATLAPQAQAKTEEQRAILKEYLDGVLPKVNGALLQPGSSMRVKIWWEK